MYMHHLWMNGEIVLNEESVDFKWCDIDDFVNLIEWTGDKMELKNVLISAINNKIYFKDIKIDQTNINIKIFTKPNLMLCFFYPINYLQRYFVNIT